MSNTRGLLVSLEDSIILFLLCYFIFRIFSDFTYTSDKPSFVKISFIVLSLILVVYNANKLINKTDIIIVIISSLMVVYPMFFSQSVIEEQILYGLKVVLIPLVIIACSHLEISFEKLRCRAQIVIPFFIAIALVYFFSQFTLNISELYNAFDNNPFHPISQTVAKLSFLFLYVKKYFLFIFLGVLILLNVRSNLLPILSIIIFINFKKHFKNMIFGVFLITAIILVTSSLNTDLISIDGILERFITKNRTQGYAGEGLQNLSSGRTEIWAFYFNYIIEEYTLVNYLFGTGSLEFQGKYPINAHNDFINIIINFGLFGLFGLGLVYYEVYRRLEPKYRNYVALYFIFVFITNGIMFHQSNVFFLLYLRDHFNDGLSSNTNYDENCDVKKRIG